MEKLKTTLNNLRSIDADLYSIDLLLDELLKSYSIDKNPQAYSCLCLFKRWFSSLKKDIDQSADDLDDYLTSE